MIHYDFNDILITPARISTIRSRSEISPLHKLINEWLPLIVSPMDTVISTNNWKNYLAQKMPICFPRGIKPKDIPEIDQVILNNLSDGVFFSYSLEETDELVNLLESNKEFDHYHNILIDIANGHMKHLADIVSKLRKLTKAKIMVGNIANPDTYKVLSDAGADYIRVGVGFGGGCLTAMNTGIGYSMATLIKECNQQKKYIISEGGKPAFIVADGGFREYSDIIKAIALGADWVMLGSILNKSLESAGDTYWSFYGLKIKVGSGLAKFLWKHKFKLEKKFRGMSTKEVQLKWGKQKLTTSEGVVRMRTVKYTLTGWTENFVDYLKSSMSYTNYRELSAFIGGPKFTQISQNSFMRFNK